MALIETNEKLLKEIDELKKLESKRAKIDEKIAVSKKKIEELQNRKSIEEYTKFRDSLIDAGISEIEIFEAISKRDFSLIDEKIKNF